MLTGFGKILRKLRVDHNERILDMAEKIGKSSAFISAVERGQKPIPEGFDDLIIQAYDLHGQEAQAIRKAYARSKISFQLKSDTDLARDAADLLAKRINVLSQANIKEFRELWNKIKDL